MGDKIKIKNIDINREVRLDKNKKQREDKNKMKDKNRGNILK